MSVASSGVKKRKKPDAKPQSQINKCLNEKRRREQENIFIEELAELISVSFSDMNSLSVKPDKCAILQETVHQIRNIKQQQELQQQQQNQQNQQGVVSTDDIQQGEVSSSKPTHLSNEIFGPLLLEALEGFAFFLNPEGKVEHVTDNVSQYIKFNKDEILGKSIYSIIHPGDHGRFSSCLLPTSIGNFNQSGSGGSSNQQSKNRPFCCRMLVKDDDVEDSVTDSKDRLYEQVQISSTFIKGDGACGGGGSNGSDVSSDYEMGPGLICVARRIPSTEKHLSAPIEQFTTKLDPSYRIIGIDTSGTSSTYSLYLNKDLTGKSLKELCHADDLPKLNAHLKETMTVGQGLSKMFRFMMSAENYIHVQTKSKLFKSSNPADSFIMTTYSIIRDPEVCGWIESGSQHLPANSAARSHGGGPMVNALANGRHSTVTTPDNSKGMPLTNNPDYPPFTDISFDQELFGMEERPTSLFEGPPSTANLTSVASPMNPYSHASPITNPPSTPFSSSLPFSPVENDTKDNKEMMMSDGDINDSARLRDLLTNSSKRSSIDDDSNRRRTQEGMLNNQDDNMDTGGDAGLSPGQKKPMTSTPRMLLELLNKKPDESELQQLLSKPEDTKLSMPMQSQSTILLDAEDRILQSLGIGFSNSSPPPDGARSNMRKRPSDDSEDNVVPTKKIPAVLDSIPAPIVPVQNRSNLQEKNKMLASLLAKQPAPPATIPHLPPSLIYATPQDRLPKVTPRPATASSGNNIQQLQQGQMRLMAHPQRQNVPSSSSPYLNDLLQPQHQQQQLQHFRQIKIGNNRDILSWEMNPSDFPDSHPDPELSTILDELLNNNPEIEDNPHGINLMDAFTTPDGVPTTMDISAGVSQVSLSNPVEVGNTEKTLLIREITRSFMQCEQEQKPKIRMQAITQQVVLQQQLQQQISLQQQQQAQSSVNQTNQQFNPPPMYQQHSSRLGMHPNANRLATRASAPQYSVATSTAQYNIQQVQQNNKYLQVQQKRLLQQQQQQSLLIPSNATANSQTTTNLQNIDLSVVPPPNVSLQRSTSLTESSNTQQLSPGGNPAYGNSLLSSSQISPSQRQQPSSLPSPYSPLSANPHQQQSFSSLNFSGGSAQQSPTQPPGARLSPSAFQGQLSPRVSQPQTSYAVTTVMTSQGAQQVQSQSGWPSPQHQQQQQQQQQQHQQQQQQQQQLVNNRLSLQQQQNPMLDARLSGNAYTANNRASMFAQQPQKSQQAQSPQLSQVRGMTTSSARQSPFPADISPTPATSYAPTNNQQYRLQRSMNVTSNAAISTSQVPTGNNNCIRSYSSNMGNSLNLKDTSQNTPPHPPPLYSPMMYSHHGESSPYCYPDQSLPMYGDRSRIPHSSGTNNANNNNNSEYVKQELRAKVARQQPRQLQVSQMMDLEALGITMEDNDGQRWGNMNSDMNDGSPSMGLSVRTSLDGTNPNNMNSMTNVSGSDKKSSLLQKLLSE